MGDTLYYEVLEKEDGSGLIQSSLYREDPAGSDAQLLARYENTEILWFRPDARGDVYLLCRTGGESPQHILRRLNAGGEPAYEQAFTGEEGDALGTVRGGMSGLLGGGCLFLFPPGGAAGRMQGGLGQGNLPWEPVRAGKRRGRGGLCLPDIRRGSLLPEDGLFAAQPGPCRNRIPRGRGTPMPGRLPHGREPVFHRAFRRVRDGHPHIGRHGPAAVPPF